MCWACMSLSQADRQKSRGYPRPVIDPSAFRPLTAEKQTLARGKKLVIPNWFAAGVGDVGFPVCTNLVSHYIWQRDVIQV